MVNLEQTSPAAIQWSQHKTLRFWLLQLCGWLPFYLFQFPIFGGDDWVSVSAFTFAGSVTMLAVTGSLLLRRVFNLIARQVTRIDVWLLVIILSGFLIALAVDAVHHGFWFLTSQVFSQLSVIHESQPFMVITGFLWLAYVIWGSLYMALSKQEKLNTAMINEQRLELLVQENKIQSLLDQLNPHFMFNAINNIRALILQDSDKARDMLASFADIMRYQINSHNDALVKLEDELDFVIEYIELHRLQLGKRLQFTQSVDSALLTHFIPRMALQLLVENAIKHGFSQFSGDASLCITIASDPREGAPQAWYMSVKNSGRLQGERKTDSGVGLLNLEERLRMQFADDYQLTLVEKDEIVECRIQFNY